ncbi:MAG: (d)CMP kinase [Chloroflexi bacterium]|nr:(d)CMP kinase [Chloroflexota bacterium]
MVVAIDGPAGAGKSTVARTLADQHTFQYIDSGAMYRCVALCAQRSGISPQDHAALGACARSLRIEFRSAADGQQVLVDGEDVTAAIRENAISQLTSVVSQSPPVREAMTALQRSMGRTGRVVMEGRDIGTVVFPDAAVKIYLDASDRERAHRRAMELQGKHPGGEVDEAAVLRELTERDRRDHSRAAAPLTAAPDAVRVDTDGMSVQEVVDRIAALLPHPATDEGLGRGSVGE